VQDGGRVALQCVVARGVGLHGVVEAGQAVGGGAPHGHAVVVVDEPAERLLHLAEGRDDLHQVAELDRAAEILLRPDDERKDHRRLAEERGEGHQVLLLLDEQQVVAQHVAETQVELAALDLLAMVERDGFAVLAHAHQVVPEVGLEALLPEVQPDQRTADEMGDHGAHDGVPQRQPDHRADDLVGGAAGREREIARQRPEQADEAQERDHGIQQAHRERHRRAGEHLHVFLDTLVGVVRRGAVLAGVARQFQVIEGAVRHPARQVAARHPGAPAQLQQLRHIELEHLHRDVEEGDPAEHPHFAPEGDHVLGLQRVVEAPVPLVAEHRHVDVEKVEGNDPRQHGARPPFLLGPEVGRREREDAAQDLNERAGARCDG